jgi:hypothetical protein
VRTHSGVDVKIDAQPLTALDELRAAMAGRATFTRWTHSGDVHPRHPSKIRARPAGSTPRVTVHREHDCTPTDPPSPPGSVTA